MAPAKKSTKSTGKTAGSSSSSKKTSTGKKQSVITGNVTKPKPLTLQTPKKKKPTTKKDGLPNGVTITASNVPKDNSDPQIRILDHDNLPDGVSLSSLYPKVLPPLDAALKTYLANEKKAKYMPIVTFKYPPFDSMAIKFFISYLKNPKTSMPMPTLPLTLHIFDFALTFATTDFLDLTSGFVIDQINELGQECLEKGVTKDSEMMWRLLVNSLFISIPDTATKEGKAALADIQETLVTSLAPHIGTLFHDPPADMEGKGKGRVKNKDAAWATFLEKEHPGLAMRLLLEVTKDGDKDEDEDEDVEMVDEEVEGDEGVDLTEDVEEL